MAAARGGRRALVTLLVGAVSLAASAGERVVDLETDRSLVVAWLTGGFDTGPPGPGSRERWHLRTGPVRIDGVEEPGLRVLRWTGADGSGEPDSRQVWTFALDAVADAVVMELWAPAEAGAGDAPTLEHDGRRYARLEGCDVVWRREGPDMRGRPDGPPCSAAPPPEGPVWVQEMLLGPESVEIAPPGGDGAPVVVDRVRRWSARARSADGGRRSGSSASRRAVLHDRGDAALLAVGEEPARTLEVRLSRPERGDGGLRAEVREDGETVATGVWAGEDPAAVTLEWDGLRLELERAQEDLPGLDQLVDWMSGSFSSAGQAATDDRFSDVRLHMVPVWREREDGRWLYVEQALGSSPDRPYRQRVYRVREVAPGLFESAVFRLPDPDAWTGYRGATPPPEGTTPADTEARRGCEILMRRRGSAFVGGTLGTLCPSDLRGARYATSDVRITREALTTWDRGFDGDGDQVWGSSVGGYVFTRLSVDPQGGAPDPSGGP